MKYLIITSLVFMSLSCASNKKGTYCDLVEKPVVLEDQQTDAESEESMD